VPAQLAAADYLNRVCTGFCGDIIVVGHSKGGNLAVYAAANANRAVKERLLAVYSFDGPGFLDSFLQSEGYLAVKPIVRTVMSQHSIVGVLLKLAGTEVIVKSTVAGPMSHDGFNWEVLGTHFTQLSGLAAASRAYEQAVDGLVFGMSREDMCAFINEMFDILEGTGASTIAELSRLKPAAKLELLRNLHQSKRVNGFASEFLEKFGKAIL